MKFEPSEERERLSDELLRRVKRKRKRLSNLLTKVSGHWSYEDKVYRFYHQSLKVFYLQEETEQIVVALRALMPARELNLVFLHLVKEGTGKEFSPDMNERWLPETRPILEAFFHAKWMLEMAVRYSELPKTPQIMPSGWAGLLYLYNLH